MIGVDLGGKLNMGASGDVLVAVDGADVVLSLISARGGHREIYELRRSTGMAIDASSWWCSHALVMRYDELPEDFWADNGWKTEYFRPIYTMKQNNGIDDKRFAAKYGAWLKWLIGYGEWYEEMELVRVKAEKQDLE